MIDITIHLRPDLWFHTGRNHRTAKPRSNLSLFPGIFARQVLVLGAKKTLLVAVYPDSVTRLFRDSAIARCDGLCMESRPHVLTLEAGHTLAQEKRRLFNIF